MRTKRRLIEVMRTVNPHLHRDAAVILDTASRHMDGEIPPCRACIVNLNWLAEHPSPHIAELASEALHYMKEEA